jgi:hypothetical protein
LVNHWPSRRGKDNFTESDETEFARSLVAEYCGKLIDNIIKIPKEEFHRLPKCLIDCPESFLPFQEVDGRCPNGYHRSPDGDCEKVSKGSSDESFDIDDNHNSDFTKTKKVRLMKITVH